MTHVISIVILIAILAQAGTAAPTVASAEPAPEWNQKFAGKTGWIGGDGVYSVALGENRVLWFFGDTLIGEVKDGGRNGAVMVNNTIAVQSGLKPDSAIRFLNGIGAKAKPVSMILPADDKGWFWPQGVIRYGARLAMFVPQIDKSGEPGVFGFRQVGQWLVVVDNPMDEPHQWRMKQTKIPSVKFAADGDRSWGSAVLLDGQHIYIYGFVDTKKQIGTKQLIVARAPADKLDDFTSWRYLSQTGWSESPDNPAQLADGLAPEYSVTRLAPGKGFVLVYTLNGLSGRIMGRFADAPRGPWSAPTLLYRSTEMTTDRGLFTYAAKAHPWAAADDELLISYCTNSWDFARLFKDETIYRPKFVRVKLKLETN